MMSLGHNGFKGWNKKAFCIELDQIQIQNTFIASYTEYIEHYTQ